MSDESPSARYPVPASRHRVTLVVDRSRFICTVERTPTVEDAQEFIRQVSSEFADATHNCWAYVVGAPGSTDRIGLSDDGEPHGTAGRPMYTVLAHSGYGDIAVVVTRYFGGIKLGTGGLVKAYSSAVQEALSELPGTERVDAVVARFLVGYGQLGAVQQALPELEAEVLEQSFGAEVSLSVRLPRSNTKRLEAVIQNLMRGAASFDITEN